MTLSELLSNQWFWMSFLIVFATVHGYAGAWLAVRMLFRPRSPFKIFGITVFPQGMIPRHRERLAAAIGKAVGEQLFSHSTIIEELLGKDFLRRKIHGIVAEYTNSFLQREYPSIVETLPAGVRETVLNTLAALQMKLAEHIQEVLQRSDTIEVVSGFVDRRVDEFLDKQISDVIDPQTIEKITKFLSERITSAINEETFEEHIHDFLGDWIEDLVASETPLRTFFTDEAIYLIKTKSFEQIEPLSHQLAALATAERTRTQISSLIKREVTDYYENLPFFKKIFVSRDNLLNEVDDLVNKNLPNKIEETLKSESFAEEARKFIEDSLESALQKPLKYLIGKIEAEQLESLKMQASKAAVSLLRSRDILDSISAYLSGSIESLQPQKIGGVITKIHPETSSKMKKLFSEGLVNILSREETSMTINAILANQIDRFLSSPIGSLEQHISAESLANTTDSITETIISAAHERLPEAIQEFDIAGIVRDKINAFPIVKVEELVLSVAKEHLRTIELFGALFGFVIGVGQAVLYFFQTKFHP